VSRRSSHSTRADREAGVRSAAFASTSRRQSSSLRADQPRIQCDQCARCTRRRTSTRASVDGQCGRDGGCTSRCDAAWRWSRTSQDTGCGMRVSSCDRVSAATRLIHASASARRCSDPGDVTSGMRRCGDLERFALADADHWRTPHLQDRSSFNCSTSVAMCARRLVAHEWRRSDRQAARPSPRYLNSPKLHSIIRVFAYRSARSISHRPHRTRRRRLSGHLSVLLHGPPERRRPVRQQDRQAARSPAARASFVSSTSRLREQRSDRSRPHPGSRARHTLPA